MKAFTTAALSLPLALLIASLVHAGANGISATAIGLVGTAAYLVATWLVVKLAGSAVSDKKPSPAQTVIAFTALTVKLPLIYVGWLGANRLGPFGPAWFLAGLGLVYSLTVWRAVLAARD